MVNWDQAGILTWLGMAVQCQGVHVTSNYTGTSNVTYWS